MKELAIFEFTAIVVFIISVMYWNRRWRGKILDEREKYFRLQTRALIARVIEVVLVLAIAFHFMIFPLSGLHCFVLIGMAGVMAEAFGNWYFRRV